MITDPKEFELLEQRMAAKLRGQQAESTLRTLKEWFEHQQKLYLQTLIVRTREDGMPASSEVWKLVALDDVFQSLASIVSEGRVAEKKLEKEVNA